MRQMLSCGCAANATDKDGKPTCAIHIGLGHKIVPVNSPNMAGRIARCSCGNERPSDSDGLAFFQYRQDSAKDSYYCGCWGWD